jgi:UDP-N-acetylmuramoyl-tripeptide--D-alanyl-D-alanine ligase
MMNLKSLWTSEEVSKLIGGKSSQYWAASGVSIDSRTVKPGDLFIPICGPNFDGHNFIGSALEKGAVASVFANGVDSFAQDMPMLKVADTVQALNKLGLGGRNRSVAKIIGVAGSVGKTGVKEALGKLLSDQGSTSFNLGSYNNHLGVPLSLARLPRNADYGIFELGMNHSGELALLSQIVRPNVALITTVEAAHTEFFSSTDEVAQAKAEIFDGLQKGGTAILNRDNQYFGLLYSAAFSAGAGNVISFGGHSDSQFRLIDFVLSPQGSSVKVCWGDNNFTYQLSMPGRHWVQNSLAVLAGVYAVGADVIEAAQSFVNITPFKGRGQFHTIPIQGGHFELIDDSYNACPISVSAAIEVLARLEPELLGRRICILGDMKELGANSTELHRALAIKISDARVDLVFAVGPEMRSMCDELPSAIKTELVDKSDEIIQPLLDTLKPGDIVLVKGSASGKMSKVVDRLMDPIVELNASSIEDSENSYVI